MCFSLVLRWWCSAPFNQLPEILVTGQSPEIHHVDGIAVADKFTLNKVPSKVRSPPAKLANISIHSHTVISMRRYYFQVSFHSDGY